MKKLFLKNVMPVAVIALGISGAFVTTSMQNASKIAAPISGYTLDAQGDCNIEVNCDDSGSQVCRVNGATGAQAFGKDAQGNCNQVLYRPAN